MRLINISDQSYNLYKKSMTLDSPLHHTKWTSQACTVSVKVSWKKHTKGTTNNHWLTMWDKPIGFQTRWYRTQKTCTDFTDNKIKRMQNDGERWMVKAMIIHEQERNKETQCSFFASANPILNKNINHE